MILNDDGRPLLLLLDFDGTLAPIAPTPDAVEIPTPLTSLLGAFAERGDLVHVVTGRDPAFLRERVGPVAIARPSDHDPDHRRATIAIGVERARQLAALLPGLLIEDKGSSLALHYRQVPRELHDRAREAARSLLEDLVARDPTTEVVDGHEVVELCPTEARKSAIVRRLVAAHPDRRVVYVGDDLSDEEAFAALPADGVAVRVAEDGVPTRAQHRVPDVPAVYALLTSLASR